MVILVVCSVSAEAQDRAFRIGQKRDVSVYRFIAAGAVRVGRHALASAMGRGRPPLIPTPTATPPLTQPTVPHLILPPPSPPTGTIEEMVYSRQICKEQHSKMALLGEQQPRVFTGAPPSPPCPAGPPHAGAHACCWPTCRLEAAARQLSWHSVSDELHCAAAAAAAGANTNNREDQGELWGLLNL